MIFALPIYINQLMLSFQIEDNIISKSLFSINLVIFAYYLFYKEIKFFGFGFLTGIFWFFWISFSFIYYDLIYLIPIVILIIALFYGIVFYIIEWIKNRLKVELLKKIYLIIVFTYGLDYISPFTFDWLKTEILFVNSFFGVDKLSMIITFSAIAFLKESRYLSIILLLFTLDKSKDINLPHLKIYLSNTQIPQSIKWKDSSLTYQLTNNFEIIKKAIKLKQDVVILPESAFPMFLNRHPEIENFLKFLSQKITIITGSLNEKDNKFFNATYIFQNRKEKIIYKHILVPFGEYIPLPFLQKEINKIFFNDSSDYTHSKHFSTFKIKNYQFINAICYEVTTQEIYKLKSKYIIAISNNGWFTPSIEPSLQEMIIKVYAKKYNKIVFHSVNDSPSYVITPKRVIFKTLFQ